MKITQIKVAVTPEELASFLSGGLCHDVAEHIPAGMVLTGLSTPYREEASYTLVLEPKPEPSAEDAVPAEVRGIDQAIAELEQLKVDHHGEDDVSLAIALNRITKLREKAVGAGQ